jgi:putative heme iron utilization protein
MRRVDSGVLSTMSVELPGYPFGSITPFIMTHEGRVVIYVSDIAQHTKNMNVDRRVCLTVIEHGDGNQQALGRVTVVGDAAVVPVAERDAVAERYQRLFSESRAYEKTHGFAFYWIKPVRIRYIGGFGKISWIERDDWLLPAPEWAAEESHILDHMNDDHPPAIAAMLRQRGVEADDPRMVAVDLEGFHVTAGSDVHYIEFGGKQATMDAVRSAMVELARAARSQ